MGKTHRKRRRIFNEPGHAHYLTFSCFKRHPMLRHEKPRMWLIEAIEVARERHCFDVYAFVIMPEHVHLLVRPRGETYALAGFLRDVKRPVSLKAKQYLQETGNVFRLRELTVKRGPTEVFRFWQAGGGFDRNITDQRAIREVAEYIHANPVRRCLVERPVDWFCSSATFWEGLDDYPMKMDPIPV